jgi:hypothetical protein
MSLFLKEQKMKYLNEIITSSIALSFLFSSFAAFAETSQVSVVGELAERLLSLNRIEKNQEKDIRKYRQVGSINIRETYKRRSRMKNVHWANEAFVPNIEDYGFVRFVSAMADESLSRAGLKTNGKTYKFEIVKLKVKNHSLAALRGVSTYAKGRVIEIEDKTGRELRSVEVLSNVNVGYSVSWNYKGPDFAFNENDEHSRFGPVMVSFIRKGLKKLHPNTDFPKPVSIQYAGL